MCSLRLLPPSSRSTAAQVVLVRATNNRGSLILLLPCWFVAVGMVLGAVTGALIGLATESGLVRGAGIGAISGAVVSMEVVDSSVAIWRSDESGIWSVLYVVCNCTDPNNQSISPFPKNSQSISPFHIQSNLSTHLVNNLC
jgi:hypothetical protein